MDFLQICVPLNRVWGEIKESSQKMIAKLGHGNKLRVMIKEYETDDDYIKIIE